MHKSSRNGIAITIGTYCAREAVSMNKLKRPAVQKRDLEEIEQHGKTANEKFALLIIRFFLHVYVIMPLQCLQVARAQVINASCFCQSLRSSCSD